MSAEPAATGRGLRAADTGAGSGAHGHGDDGRAVLPGNQVSLAMYLFAHLRGAYDRLWAAVAADLGSDWPSTLTWSDDVAGLVDDDRMLVSQTCGWPLVTRRAGRVRVVGSFGYLDNEPGAGGRPGPMYRSRIVARRPGHLAEFAGARAAVNNPDSLSGWVSLRHTLGVPTEIEWTGAHRLSLVALQEGRAEVASIDAVSFAHVAATEPQLTEGLHTVGRGPLVASLPVVAHRALGDDALAALRAGLVRHCASADPILRIAAFHPLDLPAYAPVAALDPELFAEQHIG